MIGTIELRRITSIVDRPEWFRFIHERFSIGQDQGYYPAHRAGPAGGEEAVVASQAGEKLGFATFYWPYEDRKFCWVDLVWVEKAYRGRGIGTLIMEEVVHLVSGPGVTIQVGTDLTNTAMRQIAVGCGFAERSVILMHGGEAAA